MDSEAISGGILGGSGINPGYDANGRLSTLTGQLTSGVTVSHGFGYDPASGRMNLVSDNSVNYGYYGGVTATYGYRPNSDQIATTAITSSTGTELLTHSRTYEGPDRLKSVVASRNGAVIEGYTLGFAKGRRHRRETLG